MASAGGDWGHKFLKEKMIFVNDCNCKEHLNLQVFLHLLCLNVDHLINLVLY